MWRCPTAAAAPAELACLLTCSHPDAQLLLQIKCIMKQLLKGLAYVHGNGVLHRDLKVCIALRSRKGLRGCGVLDTPSASQVMAACGAACLAGALNRLHVLQPVLALAGSFAHGTSTSKQCI